MTRTLCGRGVAVELGIGSVTAHWSDIGISAGPLVARAHVDDRAVRSDRSVGSWRVDTGDAYGRPGAWARWEPREPAVGLAVHVPTDDDVLVVQSVYVASTASTLQRLVPMAGLVDVAAPPESASRLVQGYDSWSYAGVRPAAELGVSWWGTVVAGPAGGFGVQAVASDRFATAVASRLEGDRLLVDVACGATPPVSPIDGSWGYETLPPPGIGVPVAVGAIERSRPIAMDGRPRSTDGSRGTTTASSWTATSCSRRTRPPRPLPGSSRFRPRAARRRLVGHLRRVVAQRPVPGRSGRAHRGGAGTRRATRPVAGALHGAARYTRSRNRPCRLGRARRRRGAAPRPLWPLRTRRVEPRGRRLAAEAGHTGAGLGLRHGQARLPLPRRGRGRPARRPRYRHRSAPTRARAIVDALGDDIYVLGCGMPLLPAVGLCHGNRVGHDLAVPVRLREFGQPLREGSTGFHGIRPQARNVAARFAMHRRWFEADPDVVMAWGRDGASSDGYSVEESRTLATLAALCGGSFLLADELAALTADERAVLEHEGLLELVGGDGFRPVDLFELVDTSASEQFFAQGDLASVWIAERRGRLVAALFNWTDAAASRRVPDGFAGVNKLWSGKTVDGPTIAVPAHAVRVLVT